MKIESDHINQAFEINPGGTVLSKEDFLRLELAQERLKSVSAQVGFLQLEDRLDELTIHNYQLQQQVKSQELQIRRKDRERDARRVLQMQSSTGNALEELKSELGKKYKVSDWSRVAYNDITGEINPLPEAPQKE